jgi:hypothetical protein
MDDALRDFVRVEGRSIVVILAGYALAAGLLVALGFVMPDATGWWPLLATKEEKALVAPLFVMGMNGVCWMTYAIGLAFVVLAVTAVVSRRPG